MSNNSNSALRYDEDTGRLDLVTEGQSLKNILLAYNDIKSCLQTIQNGNGNVTDVLSNPIHVFRQMHEVFSRCRVEKNMKGLILINEIMIMSLNSFPNTGTTSGSKLKNTCIKPLLSDIISCLIYPECNSISETLLYNIHNGDEHTDLSGK